MLFLDKRYGPVRAPFGLVPFCRDVAVFFLQGVVVLAHALEPVRVLVALANALVRCMAVPEVTVPVVPGAQLRFVGHGRGQVEFACQGTFIACIGQGLCHEGCGFVPAVIAVDARVHCTGIHAGQEACAAGRADRRLAVRVRKRHALFNEPVEVWGANMGIAQRMDRVITLLVRADPQDVGSLWCGCCMQMRAYSEGHAELQEGLSVHSRVSQFILWAAIGPASSSPIRMWVWSRGSSTREDLYCGRTVLHHHWHSGCSASAGRGWRDYPLCVW